MSLEPSSAPFGFTPFGVGTPVDAPAPPEGLPTLVRYIDPTTRDHIIDPMTGHIAEMPSVRQRFLLIALTIKKSASVLPAMGLDLPDLIDDSFSRRVDVSVRESARPMTEIEKVARVNAVTVETTALGRVLLLINYTDLTTGVTPPPVSVVLR